MNKLGNNQEFGRGGPDAADDSMLSDAGRSRRDEMLVELQGVVVGEGRRRRAVRSCSLAVMMILVGVTIVGRWPVAQSPVAITMNNKIEQKESISHIQIVRSRPEAVAAMIALPTVDLSTYYVDDRELVNTLSSIGRPSGLIRKGGDVRLAAAVIDPILQPH